MPQFRLDRSIPDCQKSRRIQAKCQGFVPGRLPGCNKIWRFNWLICRARARGRRNQGGCHGGPWSSRGRVVLSVAVVALSLLGGGYAGVSLLTAERLTRPTNHPLPFDPRRVSKDAEPWSATDQRWGHSPGLVSSHQRTETVDCPRPWNVELVDRDGGAGAGPASRWLRHPPLRSQGARPERPFTADPGPSGTQRHSER